MKHEQACRSCARPLEVGDDIIDFAPVLGGGSYHAGCSRECPFCTTGALWAAARLPVHVADAHTGTDAAREPEVAEPPNGWQSLDVPPRQRVLDEAGRIIASDRNSTYGEPEDNLSRIAQLWSVLFERPVSAREVAWAMCLVKIAREVHSPHADNPVDVAGYAALAGEVSGGAA